MLAGNKRGMKGDEAVSNGCLNHRLKEPIKNASQIVCHSLFHVLIMPEFVADVNPQFSEMTQC